MSYTSLVKDNVVHEYTHFTVSRDIALYYIMLLLLLLLLHREQHHSETHVLMNSFFNSTGNIVQSSATSSSMMISFSPNNTDKHLQIYKHIKMDRQLVWLLTMARCLTAYSDLDSRLAYPRPRPRLWGSKTKTKTQQFQDQDPRLIRPILEVYDWDGLWQTESHDKQKIQHNGSCTTKHY